MVSHCIQNPNSSPSSTNLGPLGLHSLLPGCPLSVMQVSAQGHSVGPSVRACSKPSPTHPSVPQSHHRLVSSDYLSLPESPRQFLSSPADCPVDGGWKLSVNKALVCLTHVSPWQAPDMNCREGDRYPQTKDLGAQHPPSLLPGCRVTNSTQLPQGLSLL